MKKTLLTIIGLFSFFCFSGCGKKEKNEIKSSDFSNKSTYKYEGKGKLKSTVSYTYGDKPYKRKVDTIYDEKDQVVLECNYYYKFETETWVLSTQAEKKYDDLGRVTLETKETHTTRNNGIHVDYYSTEYNYEDDLLMSEIETSGFEKAVTSYEYDENKNITKVVYRGPRDYRIVLSEYDENNNLIKKTYKSSGNGGDSWYMTDVYEFTYDSLGREKTEILSYLIDDSNPTWRYDHKYEYEYSDSNLISETFYVYRDDIWKVDNKNEYEYNDDNYITAELYYISRDNETLTLRTKKEYVYDSNNRNILNIYYNEKNGKLNESVRHEYNYNDKDELTLEIIYSGEEITKREENKYTYYK